MQIENVKEVEYDIFQTRGYYCFTISAPVQLSTDTGFFLILRDARNVCIRIVD